MIYILLPVHNRKEITMKFVQCLARQTHQDFHLILLDDGSVDGTSEAVKQVCDKLTVLQGTGQWWWAGALQEGYKYIHSKEISANDIILIINDDVEFGPDFLMTGKKLLEENPGHQVCARHLEKGTNAILDRGVSFRSENFLIAPVSADRDLYFLSTRGLFLPAVKFIESGGFVPEIYPHYFSDYEFTRRLFIKCGLKMMTSDKLVVYGVREKTFEDSLRGKNPISSLRIIFSNKFISNPIMWSRVVLGYCEPEHKLRHLFRIWRSFLRRWLLTFPRWFFTPLLVIIFPVGGFLRGLWAAIRVERYQNEPDKK